MMRSLRTKLTVITVGVVTVAIILMSLLCILSIRKTERRRSEQALLLLCETGARNLDYYFSSVQKSVNDVSLYISSDIDRLDEESLAAHMERVKGYFEEKAYKTNGVLTYYYRIDPTVSDTVKGFWYMDLTGEGFVEHEVTDITLYDTADTSALVWFTVPKFQGKPVWLSPYVTDNLDVKVISYNVPVYFRGNFIGVVGIEIDYSTMAEQVESIRLFNNGYAFINDKEGSLFYHPYLDVSQFTPETTPVTPRGVVSESSFVRYTFDGVQKEAVWLSLSNGMRLNVTAPVAETEGDWRQLIVNIIVAGTGVLIAAGLFTLFYTQKISKPLKQLTVAAEQVDSGNYDYELTYEGNDELGVLTRTFKRLSGHMRDNIANLNRRVYTDALTHVKNKGAFSSYLDKLQDEADDGKEPPKFLLGVFDCDNLKLVNDKYGHDKGDIYLQTASHTICTIFKNSPVFRIGGDEFSVILQGDDYRNREALIKQFEDACERINAATENEWEQIHISFGFAEYDPLNDGAVSDVLRRADKVMYENKRLRKKALRKAAEEKAGADADK